MKVSSLEKLFIFRPWDAHFCEAAPFKGPKWSYPLKLISLFFDEIFSQTDTRLISIMSKSIRIVVVVVVIAVFVEKSKGKIFFGPKIDVQEN